MARHGVDQLRVISTEEMQRLQTIYPIEWLGFYLYSPGQQRTRWTPADIIHLSALGLQFLPIYVGQNNPTQTPWACKLTTDQAGLDARDAAGKMEAFGWPRGYDIPVALDIEYETFAWDPTATADYSAAFLAEISRLGYLPTIYGSPVTIEAVGHQCGGFRWQAWIANWQRHAFDGSLNLSEAFPAGFEGRRIWQYASQDHDPRMDFLGYDWDVADATLAPALPFTPPEEHILTDDDRNAIRLALDEAWRNIDMLVAKTPAGDLVDVEDIRQTARRQIVIVKERTGIE